MVDLFHMTTAPSLEQLTLLCTSLKIKRFTKCMVDYTILMWTCPSVSCRCALHIYGIASDVLYMYVKLL